MLLRRLVDKLAGKVVKLNIIQIMEKALAALDSAMDNTPYPLYREEYSNLEKAIEELKKAEPIAWALMRKNGNGYKALGVSNHPDLDGQKWEPLYFHPSNWKENAYTN